MKALLVDDDPDLVILASHVLEHLGGFGVTSSAGGDEVIELARREQPDVILMDYLMPEPDGAELARRLFADELTAGIPLIFLTAKEGREERRRLLDLGAKGVLVKPFEPESLAAEVKRLLAERITDLDAEQLGPESACVSFLQLYVSDSYRDTTRKTLDLIVEDGRWKISGERSGP